MTSSTAEAVIGTVRQDEPAARARVLPPKVVNAMTIDVEDYFHVSAFDGLLPRDRWTML